MNKKVIKAMFANICDKSELRPVMNGVHFEKERCYASDGHVLVIFKEGSEKFEGKTMSIDGEEIEGRYPNIDNVFPPKEQQGEPFKTDFVQLKNACAYHIRLLSSCDADQVIVNGISFNVRTLNRILNTIMMVGDPKNIVFYCIDKSHAVVIESDQMRSLIMPCLYEETEIDFEGDFGDKKVMSYENFINDYVFNSWKKQPKNELQWVD